MLRSNWFIKITILLIFIFAVQFIIVGCAKKGKEETTEQKTTTEETAIVMEEEKEISPDELPTAILDAFKAEHPEVNVFEAELEIVDSITYYEVEFEVGTLESSVLYTADGTVVEVEEEITEDALPDAVKQTAAREYPNCELKAAERITQSDGSISYELVILFDEDELEIVVSTEGKILSIEQEEEEADEDDDADE